MGKKVIFLLTLFLVSLSSSTIDDTEENYTIFVDHKIGVSDKYGILELKNNYAYLELYTKFKGDVVPINMSWNSKIEPQVYIYNEVASDSVTHVYSCGSSEIRIKNRKASIFLENSFIGVVELELHAVKELPTKYHHLRNHAYMFTGRNAVGFNFKKTGIGYDHYDKLMQGHLLYKERDKMEYSNFISKYDSVQQHIYTKIYTIQDSISAMNLIEEVQAP